MFPPARRDPARASTLKAHDARAAAVYRYDHVAWCYETLARLGSLGAIPRLKRAQLETLVPGSRLLYVGAGSGEDVVAAAARGFEVTALDHSPRMLARLEARLERAGLKATLIEADLATFEGEARHDVVFANFFLNVFAPQQAQQMLACCRTQLRPSGQLLIGDFRPPDGGLLQRVAYNAYYRPLDVIAWALGLCALHPIYDYARWFEAAGLELIERRPMTLGPGARGPATYETLVSRPAVPTV